MLNSASSSVGGTNAGDGNVISGNTGWGIMLQQSTASGNKIVGNVIGTSADGSTALPNGSGGDLGAGRAEHDDRRQRRGRRELDRR